MGRSNNIILQNKRIEKQNYNKKEKDKKDGQSRYIDLFGDKEKRNRGQNRYEYLPNEKTKMKVNMSQIILKY